MDLGLAGKTFVVTAASGGLGRATGEALLAEGANVVAVARRQEVLSQWQATAGDSLVTMAADLADPGTPNAAVGVALDSFGGLDGALISVGGPKPGAVLDNPDSDWLESFNSVFLAALRSARAVVGSATSAPALAFVLSTSSRAPLPTMAISNGLRPGLGMLIKQLADEIGPAGGRAVGLMPGLIATERINNLYDSKPPAALEAATAGIPLGRIGDPAEFGRIAAFVLSPAASYLSGCLIPVDGGALRTI